MVGLTRGPTSWEGGTSCEPWRWGVGTGLPRWPVREAGETSCPQRRYGAGSSEGVCQEPCASNARWRGRLTGRCVHLPAA